MADPISFRKFSAKVFSHLPNKTKTVGRFLGRKEALQLMQKSRTQEKKVVLFQPMGVFKDTADKIFEEQKTLMLNSLPFAEAHHIGSTAIPDSLTKGDVDVNVRVKDRDFHAAVDVLKKMYDINQPDNWTDTFASFKDSSNLEIDFGVQLTTIGGPEDDFVYKRDILLSCPDLVEKLNALKRKWEGKSMEEYRKEKSDFFDNIVK